MTRFITSKSSARSTRIDPVLTIALAQLFGTSLWFSANSASDDLVRAWHISPSDIGTLTASVQAGFIIGTLVFALFGLADRYRASHIFCVSAVLGAIFNAWFATLSGGLHAALLLRFLVGICMAGIYPIGMKLIISWAPERAAAALSLLVGMLTFGTALPHGLRALAAAWPWPLVIAGSSLLAITASVMVYFLGDGPHLARRSIAGATSRGDPVLAFRNARFRAVAIGYFGHMWELYAFWTLVPMLVQASSLGRSSLGHSIAGTSFVIIAAGSLGCILGGILSRWLKGEYIALAALACSGTCCLAFPFLVSYLPPFWILVLLVIWGATVVADSPQFSALAAAACPRELIGGALAIQNSIGFALTVASIAMVTSLHGSIGAWTVWLLLPGPALGIVGFLIQWRRA